MLYLASLRARGMPDVPIQHINSANADTPTLTSVTQATRLPSRRESPHAGVRPLLATNRIISGPGECLIGISSSANLAPRHSEALKNVEEHPAIPQLTSRLHGSPDYEYDLAAMVHDFMENGSHESDLHESSNGERSASTDLKPFETLRAAMLNSTLFEKELLSVISMIILSMSDQDLACVTPASRKCKGGCIRRLLVKHLQLMNYNAAVCISKWPSAGKVPRGEYEYIDVFFDNSSGKSDRVIVDVDFRSQFEIARPTPSYLAALRCLPVLFIGSIDKLSQVLQVLAGAAKLSLKQNAMPLPPWRTLSYLNSKWMSPCERLNAKTDENLSTYERGHENARPTEQCVQELQYLKVCMSSGVFVPQM